MVDRLIKERHYVLYTIEDNDIFVKSIIEMLIKKVFRLYELLTLIMFDRGSQFIIII